MVKKIISFGFKYADAPDESLPGVVVVDVRSLFRNPHSNRTLRYLNGLNPAVQADVEKTPEFTAKYRFVRDQVTVPGTETAFIGCHGGRHRSVFLAEKLAKELGVSVEHRDLERAS